ncbi:class I SAM-dependent methyltransferase [Cohnella algarum]|uniref:class I SAM-dependent methyltransferase n=1 Tax=Cohnella algarum TaxID=2044859 RepID=UPI001967AE1B|nr:methyltransferase domain-containing protein [Cohnella algarum]MBN2980607.1 class I SAM-dependent methyltransferase [Cohnella algarum]
MSKIYHEHDRMWEKDKIKIIDCKTCGFIHLYPIPTKNDIEEFYKLSYFSEIKPFDYGTVTESYVEKKTEQVLQNSSYKYIYNKVINLLHRSCSSSFRMLDIGCGNDLLAKYFQIAGWETNVLEPNKDAAYYLSRFGISVCERFAEEIDEIGFKDLSFVNIQFVLEHIADPVSLLEKVHKAMAPGGLSVFVFPMILVTDN